MAQFLKRYFNSNLQGIRESEPRGDKWKDIGSPAGTTFKQISVSSDNDEVWAISTKDEVFYREGVDEETNLFGKHSLIHIKSYFLQIALDRSVE